MNVGSYHGSAAKESAIDLEVAGSGLVGCRFVIPFSFLPYVYLEPVFHLLPWYATIFISHKIIIGPLNSLIQTCWQCVA